MRLTGEQILLANLEQKISEHHRAYQFREDAYIKLCERTGQDFGYDVEKWREWLKAQNRGKKSS